MALNRSTLFSILSTALMHAATDENENTGSTAMNTEQPAASNKPEEVKVPEGMKAVAFHFRREKIKDEATNTEIEVYKHPTVTIPLPIPTREEVQAVFNAPTSGDGSRIAEQKFILDLIDDAIYRQAREQINEFREANDPKTQVTANALNYDQLTITALANMPPSERGKKFDEEDMKGFLSDYAAIMPDVASKDANKIKAQCGILEKELRTVKTDKKVLEVMDRFLTMWAGATENLEEYQEVYDYLKGRITRWMKKEPQNLMEAIV